MIIEMAAPSPGESISEVEIGTWLIEDGDHVEKDQEIAEIESDKATLPLVAEDTGKIKILINTGETVTVGTILCTIDTGTRGKVKKQPSVATPEPVPEKTAPQARPVEEKEVARTARSDASRIKVSPVARKMMDEHKLSVDDIISGLKKITKNDVNAVLKDHAPTIAASREASRDEDRNRMTSLRRKLSQRLVTVKNETAMLTTFNEVDMSEIIRLRKTWQNAFVEKHGVKLGYMSFFTKAATLALLQFPDVNSRIEDEDIVTPSYCDIGIAVQGSKGLMVPVLRNTEVMSLADMEHTILDLAEKARSNRLSIPEMTGGTFTITNGGVFGSMLSTPIINPPQSAILGMHNIVDRPMAVDGNIVIRPVMYLALSYDHRIIDGKESVSFLVQIKEYLENPLSMIFQGNAPDKVLLDL
jgi:2-oxoglutarate dehydrogenase E2 component (dihydrolipoamide succinyltransferase)